MQLNISERIAALAILNNFKGNLETMAAILDDIKQLPVSDDEWKAANREENKIGNTIQWSWNDEKGGLKEISFQKPTQKYLKETIKNKDDKGEITFQDKALVSLNNKL
jgi:hypothetical protein